MRRQFRNISCPHCGIAWSAGPSACPHAASCEFPICGACRGKGRRLNIIALVAALTAGGIGIWMLGVYLREAAAGQLKSQDRSLVSAAALTLGGLGFAGRMLLRPWCAQCSGAGRVSKYGSLEMYYLRRPKPAAAPPPEVPARKDRGDVDNSQDGKPVIAIREGSRHAEG